MDVIASESLIGAAFGLLAMTAAKISLDRVLGVNLGGIDFLEGSFGNLADFLIMVTG